MLLRFRTQLRLQGFVVDTSCDVVRLCVIQSLSRPAGMVIFQCSLLSPWEETEVCIIILWYNERNCADQQRAKWN